jgi:uncharacterized membrane protein YphA (DoxX/SURF4 family)
MNIALWIVQVLLAAFYGMAGSAKVFQTAQTRENPQMTWAHGKSDGYIRFVGTAELLGVLGVILPLLTGILSWLTPLAAIGLSLVQLLAIFVVHVPKKEYGVIPVNMIALALSIFVAVGRWSLLAA